MKGRKPVIKRLQRCSFRRWQLYLPAATVLRDEATLLDMHLKLYYLRRSHVAPSERV